MPLGGVSISYGVSLINGGVGHFLGVVFFIGMGYGVAPATPPHGEQRSLDQHILGQRSMIQCFKWRTFLRLPIQYRQL